MPSPVRSQAGAAASTAWAYYGFPRFHSASRTCTLAASAYRTGSNCGAEGDEYGAALWCVIPIVPDADQKIAVKANIVAAIAKRVFLCIAFSRSNWADSM